MLLYHASAHKFEVIRRSQAKMADGVVVPEGELQNKIYLTPSLGFALAMAAGPGGITYINDDGTEISFENADEFNPEASVYVYTVESNKLNPENLEQIDQDQYTYDADELTPESVTEYKADEVFKYYKRVDFVHP